MPARHQRAPTPYNPATTPGEVIHLQGETNSARNLPVTKSAPISSHRGDTQDNPAGNHGEAHAGSNPVPTTHEQKRPHREQAPENAGRVNRVGKNNARKRERHREAAPGVERGVESRKYPCGKQHGSGKSRERGAPHTGKREQQHAGRVGAGSARKRIPAPGECEHSQGE